MPQRAASLVLAVLGVLALVGLVVVGADVYRAARAGPRWKRRLVGAGLVVLGSLGLVPASPESAAAAEAKAVAPAETKTLRTDLDQRAEWKRLVATWREAEEVASNRRGDYPFTEAGKKDLLARLEKVGGDMEALRKGALLSEAEAGLLKAELGRLVAGVQYKRPAEMRMATCYKPMMVVPARDSLKRLQERLPLLEKVAEAKAVSPEVLARVMSTVETDLATLGNAKWTEPLQPAEQADAKTVREAAQAAVDKIRLSIRGADAALTSAPAWEKVLKGLGAAQPLAASGKSTEKQRKEADTALGQAATAAEVLAVEGLLSFPEAELLIAECKSLYQEMHRNLPTDEKYRSPPTDTQVTCYVMAFLPPARQSMERLVDRLPLLEKLIARGRIAPEVLAKVLPTIEADLKTLGDEKLLGQLDKDRQVEARSSLKPRAERVLVQVRELAAKKD